ncbi:MAG TPA: tetratricopeptide repeat protein [Syntrophorhabdales bacterium]|nr:tetratricopeptide repeat protein [Syntrophorhabdales bacterium]
MSELVQVHRYTFVALTGCCSIAASLSSTYPKVRLPQLLAAASVYLRIPTSSLSQKFLSCARNSRIGTCALLIALTLVASVFQLAAAEQEGAPQTSLAPELKPIAEELERWDAEAAWAGLKPLIAQQSTNVEVLQLAAETAFFRGEYEDALKLARSALQIAGEESRIKGFALLVESTLGIIKSYKRYETAHFVISLDEKQDGILLQYLTDTLERTYQLIGDRYGFRPREKVRVELFADTKAFYYASTLSARDIEVAGAVGLCKFNKLMFLSPRALVHGYRWLDAISHEYMHYMITKLTANKAPIWFHEGLAEHEETLWRDEPAQISSVHQTLLARALADGRLISFARMDPGLVKLETPEDVQLAYAESESAIDFIIEKHGHAALKEIMTEMTRTDEKGTGSAIKNVTGLNFEEFEAKWKEFLASKKFKEVEGIGVHRYRLKEGLTDDDRMEMREIKSMIARNRAHLGDLLQEKGRLDAAVVEYRRALKESRDSVPVLNRLSEALIKMEKLDDALEHLGRARQLAPDHPNTYASLGKIYLKRNNAKKAQEALDNVIQINPFIPDAHRDLAVAYEMLGRNESARSEREIFDRLNK